MSISCGQKNNGIEFTFVMNSNSTSDDKRFVRRKNGESLSPQCIKKTAKFVGGA